MTIEEHTRFTEQSLVASGFTEDDACFVRQTIERSTTLPRPQGQPLDWHLESADERLVSWTRGAFNEKNFRFS